MSRGLPPVLIIHGPIDGESDEQRGDFRAVPRSDRGNADYSDEGAFGSYTPSERPYSAPADVRWFEGYGADKADLDRGYIEPTIREPAAYDLENYKDRYTLPGTPDLVQGDQDAYRRDFEFRGRNRRSKGFLAHPRLPTERG